MPFFSKVFKSKDSNATKGQRPLDRTSGGPVAPAKPRWGDDAWTMKSVEPQEVQELLHFCTQEAKSRALDMPFLLLPFRPDSDPSSAKIFIRSFFKSLFDGTFQYRGEALRQEMRLTEPMVLCSIMKWCWSRLPGGVVTWDVYELFRVGEQDSEMARYSFKTFLPLAVDSEYRKQIIFDFFDLLAAVAARGKTNGLGGRKLSRMAGWWAFELADDGKGFEGGYKNWARAADATSHLFFAYLRSLTPDTTTGISGISALPRSLQALVQQTEYPPETPTLMQTTTTKVVMIVDSVSPTPFALLRRARHFEYRADDLALQQWSDYEDPVQALTPECRRVLQAISSTNQSGANGGDDSSLKRSDASWSRFEDLGFSALNDDFQDTRSVDGPQKSGLRTAPGTRTYGPGGRPTTPSWADFLSSGFNEEQGQRNGAPVLLPPDKQLPPINGARAHSSQSHVRHNEASLEPGELASITYFDLDETFWWVWMTSLAVEEPDARKATFGRCALIETSLGSARWLVMEEQVKGASPGPEEGAYIAEKKSRFGFSKRGRLGRNKSERKKAPPLPSKDAINRNINTTPNSKVSLAPSQHAKIQAAAAALAEENRAQEYGQEAQRRGRADDVQSTKTNSVLTLQPVIMSEAAPAMKWAKEFDKDRIRAQYLGDSFAGKGIPRNFQSPNGSTQTGNFSGSRTPETASIMALEAMAAMPPVPPAKDTVEERSPAPSPVPKDEPVAHRAEDSSTSAQPTTFPPEEKPRPIRDTSAAAGVTEQHPSDQHPAFRQQQSLAAAQSPTTDHATIAARRAAQNSKKGSPEASRTQKESPNKLKKKEKGGLRKLFGKKKQKEVPQGFTPLEPVEPDASEGNHPAYQEKPREQQDSGVSSPHDVSAPYGYEAHPDASYPSAEPEAPGADHFIEDDPHAAYDHPPTRSDDEREQAEHEFSRFDQGPLDDQPAFAPRESIDNASDAPSSPSPAVHRRPVGMVSAPHPGQENIPPARHRHDDDDEEGDSAMGDDVSEASLEQAKMAQGPAVSDRWAQIRKNAAERQRKQSEEAGSRPSQGARTDDGETSGEETIESRVARIKARVAELTGNMDSHGNIQTGR